MVCELRAYVESAYNLSAKVVISSEMRYTFSRNRYLLHLVAVDAEGSHQAITEEFLLKTASHDGLHGEEGDVFAWKFVAFVVLGGIGTKCLDALREMCAFVRHSVEIGNHHHAFAGCIAQHFLKHLHEIVFLRYNLFYSISIEGKFAEFVAKGFAIEFFCTVAGTEMLLFRLLVGMNEIDARFVFSGSKSAIERDAVEPFWEISLRNLTTEHSLEINDEVERHVV